MQGCSGARLGKPGIVGLAFRFRELIITEWAADDAHSTAAIAADIISCMTVADAESALW